jgi:short-subunit dehydrogenase
MSYWHSKVALVTGGSSGLGRAIAAALAGAGARVAIVGARLEAAADELRRGGGEVLPLAGDLTRDADVERMVRETLQRWGRLDMLVNCAGRSARGELRSTGAEAFRELMDLNLVALVRSTHAALPHLLRAKGHVVNIGSLASKSAGAYLGAYAATKFAVAAYSQQLRLELANEGLHVLLVCPGPIARDTPRHYAGSEGLPAAASLPGGGVKVSRLRPETVAAAILRACERRKPELILPGRARLLFALGQLSPRLGDWLVRKFSQ